MSLSYNKYLDPAVLDLFPFTVTIIPALGMTQMGGRNYDTANQRQHAAMIVKSSRMQYSTQGQLEIPDADLHIAQPPINGTVPVWAELHDKIVMPDGSTPLVGDTQIHDVLLGLYLQSIKFQ